MERLVGGQVLNLIGTDEPSKQALADAAERYTAASSQVDSAPYRGAKPPGDPNSPGRAVLRAGRAHGDGNGRVRTCRPVQARAAPVRSPRTVTSTSRDANMQRHRSQRPDPHYYPGGRIAGRPVPQAGTASRGGSRHYRWRLGPGLGAAVQLDVLGNGRDRVGVGLGAGL